MAAREYNALDLPLEILMNKKCSSVALVFLLITLTLSACNLPKRQAVSTTTSSQPTDAILQSTPTPLCTNQYFPDHIGDMWEYSGTNSILGAYIRTDTITNSEPESFTEETTLANVTGSLSYDCSSAGLTSQDPVQQYAGALLSSPDVPFSVKLTSNTGTSLPAKIIPGDTWQQVADGQVNSQQLNVNGRFEFDYTAVGYENISVPAGSYNALRVDATIRIEVTGLHILIGTYTTTTWWAAEVGLVKGEGTSHVTGIDFTDSMQLTSFTTGQ